MKIIVGMYRSNMVTVENARRAIQSQQFNHCEYETKSAIQPFTRQIRQPKKN